MTFKDIFRILHSACARKAIRAASLPVLLAVMLWTAPTVRAEDPPGLSVGDTHEKILTVGQKQIPLPPGKWEVVAFQSKLAFTTNGSPIGKIADIYLARKQQNQVTMAIYVRTNLEQISATGWVRNRAVCDRKNVHFNDSDRNYNTEESECWQINHIVNTTNYTDSNVARQTFKAFQRTEFGTSTAIAPEFLVNDKYDMLFARYYLLPVRHGYESSADLKWKNSEWHPEAIRDNADRKRFVAAARKYAEELYPAIKQGFRNRLADTAPSTDFVFRK